MGMPSKTDRTSGEIDWPPALERTSPAERKHTHKFSVTFHEALEDIGAELENRIGADDWRVSTAAAHRKSDGMPYADANPDNPGVVIRWTKDGQQYAVACDRYTDWRDNARAIGLYLREKRKMSHRPVTTGQDEFATAALPSGNEEAIVAAAPGSNGQDPHDVLGVDAEAPESAIQDAAQARVKETHPDQGGDREEYQAVIEAKEALLDDA